LVRRLIGDQPIHSQQELVDMLEDAGHFVTQATVSRDLDAIGAVKVRTDDGRLRYEIQEANGGQRDEQEIARIVDEFSDSLSASQNLLVIRTRPGAANVVAGALDRARLDGLLGTVAGDDTVVAVASESVGGKGLMDALDRIGVTR
jgi:transcriptional regulator of arginine metabolism